MLSFLSSLTLKHTETTTMHEAKCYRIKDLFLIVHDWNILLS